MPASRVYIGRLSYRARESDVERFFRGYGKIRDIMLKNGYCFVEFDDDRDADDAVHDLSGKELCGDRVIVEHAKGIPRGPGGNFVRDYDPPRRGYGGGGGGGGYYGGGGGGGGYRGDRDRPRNSKGYGPPRNTDHRLIVENLSSRVSWQDLKDYMRQAGEVTFADANRYRKNEGVVEFATYEDMKEALEKLDNTEINGRKIRLIEDTKSSKRSRSRSRSRSHDRSRRSRSRSRSRSGRKRSRSHERKHSRSRSSSKSKSPPPKKRSSEARSRSRSHGSEDRSPRHSDNEMNGDENGRNQYDDSQSPRNDDGSPAQSRGSSRDKSVSRSPSPN